MNQYERNKYVTNIENVREMIEKYGVAIIEDVLNKDEINEMINGSWKTLKHITKNHPIPIKRWDTKTWRSFSNLYPKHSMLLQQWQVGHAQYVWDIRQNNKIVNVFSKIWDCDVNDLVTSFDGVSIHFPPEITKRGWFRKQWYHTDQSFLNPEFNCIQSWVTAYDINEGDATLSFIEGTNIPFLKHFKSIDSNIFLLF